MAVAAVSDLRGDPSAISLWQGRLHSTIVGICVVIGFRAHDMFGCANRHDSFKVPF
jgi:hypothetical protein